MVFEHGDSQEFFVLLESINHHCSWSFCPLLNSIIDKYDTQAILSLLYIILSIERFIHMHTFVCFFLFSSSLIDCHHNIHLLWRQPCLMSGR